MKDLDIASFLLAWLVAACSRPQLPDRVAILRPYLSELIAATNSEFDTNGVFLGSSPHRERADSLFEGILATDSPAADESIAYLLFIYVGEHPGEELVCDAARRGKRMLPIIERFSKQLPPTGLEPYPKFIKGSGALPPEALRLIKAGQTCDAE